jgi:ribose transport system ATP-binding protein
VGANVLLLDEPTNGVDAAAKNSIYELLVESVASGAVVIVSSSDIEELVLLCDRVLVTGDGVIKFELSGDEITDAALNAAVVNASHSQTAVASHDQTQDL